MKEDLTTKAISGFSWRAIEQYTVQAAQFVVSIILARLLTPHDFGLIALVLVFVNFCQVMLDSGFPDALVQGEHVDDSCCNSVFLFNIFVGSSSAIALSLCASLIAHFYKEPQLQPVITTLSLTLIIRSCGVVYSAMLVKRLQFKRLAKISLISTVASGTIGVWLAMNHFGVWSLVGQALSGQLMRLLSLCFFAVWRPRLSFQWAAVKKVAHFGSSVLIATVADSLYENLNVMVIGKLFTPTVLGFYSRADSLWRMTMSNFSSIVSSVSFPILSTIKNNPERLKKAMKSAVEMLAFICYPAAVGLISVAHPLVLTLLTQKWEPCVPFLQLLGGLWVLYPMLAINGSVLLAQGQAKRYLQLILIKRGICLLSFPIVLLGIYPFIFSQIAMGFVCYYLNCTYCGKPLQYPMSAQLRDSFPYIGCAVLMGFFIQGVRFLHSPYPALQLLLQVALGIVCYALLCRVFRLPALAKVMEAVLKWRNQKESLTAIEAEAIS